MTGFRVGPSVCADAAVGASAEWLLTDGLGGYAMGTASGLRTRRYHGLLVVATSGGIPVIQPGWVAERHLALAALDPVLTIGSRQVRLATSEWASGAIDPAGCRYLAGAEIRPGSVVHRWAVGDVVVEREMSMLRGRPAVGVVHRIVRAPGLVRLSLTALGTWRNAHGERTASSGGPDPVCVAMPDGAVVDGVWRVQGPGFRPGADWHRDARYREEAARGLPDTEDLWHVGTFTADLAAGGALEVQAWAGAVDVPPPPAGQIVAQSRERALTLLTVAGVPAHREPSSERERAVRDLVIAADHHITAAPGVVAGYPWFGEWSRDTMIAYEGLFLATGRVREGAALLRRYAAALTDGLLPATADAGTPEFNAADATLWFLHALGRHLDVTGDTALATGLLPALREILAAHVRGTRFGIGVDDWDGLLACGTGEEAAATGVALTWMDARISGTAVTPRHGKPVEINALWINGLAVLRRILIAAAASPEEIAVVGSLHDRARASFAERFPHPDGGLLDVVDAPDPAGTLTDSDLVRPNQLLAVSLPDGPLACDQAAAARVVAAAGPLVTPLGLRTLAPGSPGYAGLHRGGPAERDLAYHQGTVWPWLTGPYADAVRRAGGTLDGILDGLLGHLAEAGLGSVSETADGDPPHTPSGCPFQAWSVAELLRLLKPPPTHQVPEDTFAGQGG